MRRVHSPSKELRYHKSSPKRYLRLKFVWITLTLCILGLILTASLYRTWLNGLNLEYALLLKSAQKPSKDVSTTAPTSNNGYLASMEINPRNWKDYYEQADADHLHGRLYTNYIKGASPLTLRNAKEHHHILGGFNVGLSDVLSLNRRVPDLRAEECKNIPYDYSNMEAAAVVIIFCNEALSILARSVHSILNYSPPELLAEIVLVADKCGEDTDVPYTEGLDKIEAHMSLLPKVRLIRSSIRRGIVGARLLGINATSTEKFIILDSHIEASPGWLEPIIDLLMRNQSSLVIPKVAGIDAVSLQHLPAGIGCTLGIIWSLMEHAFNAQPIHEERWNAGPATPVTTPTMSGGLFGASKSEFYRLGAYDESMSFWGAENLELSFRVWQCGGNLMCSPCSHVYHMFRGKGGGRAYEVEGNSYLRNKMRVMDVWMDDFGDLVWQVIGRPLIDYGDTSDRKRLRRNLQCKSFDWYLKNIWPESIIKSLEKDVTHLGLIYHEATSLCLVTVPAGGHFDFTVSLKDCNFASEFVYFNAVLNIRPLGNIESCLQEQDASTVNLVYCDESFMSKNQRWQYRHPQIVNAATDFCLDVQNDEIVMTLCEPRSKSQHWKWNSYEPSLLWKQDF